MQIGNRLLARNFEFGKTLQDREFLLEIGSVSLSRTILSIVLLIKIVYPAKMTHVVTNFILNNSFLVDVFKKYIPPGGMQ